MASTYKTFSSNDIVSTKTLLHEAIPLTGTVVSGTYQEGTAGTATETNIKNYTHGMFQSVYDYPYLSSSANHVFDLTVGFSANSALSASTPGTQQAKKINIYNQMAQVLVGHDATGAIREFDEDGDLTGGTKMREVFFINVARLLTKDEIKKGSFSLQLGVNSAHDEAHTGHKIKLADTGAATDYRVNSPAGEYGILYATNVEGANLTTDDGTQKAGLIFYQAGVIVVTGSVFHNASDESAGILSSATHANDCIMLANESPAVKFSDDVGTVGILQDRAISANCDAIRHRIVDMSFNNTTELNSTIYFCRANHNEFNYSSNPTYTSSSKLVVKNVSTDSPISYITTVGLYSSDNELLAVAKLSEPLKKDPTNELTLRVRLDY